MPIEEHVQLEIFEHPTYPLVKYTSAPSSLPLRKLWLFLPLNYLLFRRIYWAPRAELKHTDTYGFDFNWIENRRKNRVKKYRNDESSYVENRTATFFFKNEILWPFSYTFVTRIFELVIRSSAVPYGTRSRKLENGVLGQRAASLFQQNTNCERSVPILGILGNSNTLTFCSKVLFVPFKLYQKTIQTSAHSFLKLIECMFL